MTRRDFAKGAALATAASYSRILGANDKVRMGYIGLGNRGDQVHDGFLEFSDNETVAVCDLKDDYMDFAIKKSRAHPVKYKDYRALLDDKNVDAVAIASPDHWHALMFIDACNAGKDAYVEKPLSLTVVEGRKMVEAAARTHRVSQVGTQRRSIASLKEAAEFARSGGIGQVTVVNSYSIDNEWPLGIGNPPDSDPPDPEEWDRWLGPAPKVPYNKNREFYKFRWFYNYSGGQLTNYGVHNMDMIRWCLGVEYPRRVTALGGKYAVQDNREIPDTLEAVWRYPGGTLVTFSQFNATAAQWSVPGCEVEIRGTKGTLYLFGDGYEVVPDPISEDEFPARSPLTREQDSRYRRTAKPVIEARKVHGKSTADTAPHARNFLDCVKSRKRCNCDIEIGHRSTSATLLANIALKTHSLLDWDAKKEHFINAPQANKLLSYKYRSPYTL